MSPRPSPTSKCRFIPACAGNTRDFRPQGRVGSVHPRVCGEHDPTTNQGYRYHGSSPRVRGTRASPVPASRRRRFIPACAGNTQAARRRNSTTPVHPRVCGEHLTVVPVRVPARGSSPRVRGTPDCGSCPCACPRFIPACAGNTPSVPRGPCDRPVHPRVCGEHAQLEVAVVGAGGSSPRVRGTLGNRYTQQAAGRFIPACAGNTTNSSGRRSRPSVHPRVCGEHSVNDAEDDVGRGSSPRVRGTPIILVSSCSWRRFIPACAGNTKNCGNTGSRHPVHPRVCGEHRLGVAQM